MEKQQSETAQYQKVTITLSSDQIAYLDEMSASIRKTSGMVVCRSSVIRAFIRAARIAEISVALSKSEEHMAQSLAHVLRAGLATLAPNQARNRI